MQMQRSNHKNLVCGIFSINASEDRQRLKFSIFDIELGQSKGQGQDHDLVPMKRTFHKDQACQT